MMNLGEIQARLAQDFESIRNRRGWSFEDVAVRIKELGGDVGSKTVYNVEKNATNYEFRAIYWIARAYDLPLGELLQFTVEIVDQRAHTMVSSVMRLDEQDRNFCIRVLDYILKRGSSQKIFRNVLDNILQDSVTCGLCTKRYKKPATNAI